MKLSKILALGVTLGLCGALLAIFELRGTTSDPSATGAANATSDDVGAGSPLTLANGAVLNPNSNTPTDPQPNGDPYAAGQKALGDAEYQQAKAALLAKVQVAVSAARCRVIPPVEASTIALTGARVMLDEEAAAGQSPYHPDLDPAIREALTGQDGQPNQPGACDYWQQHPEAVAEIRQEGELAISNQ